MIRGDKDNSAWVCLHHLLAAWWPLRKTVCLLLNVILLKYTSLGSVG